MNLGYLFSAYLAIWICLGVYLLFLGNRQRSLRREIKRLHKELESRRKKTTPL